MRCRYLTYEYFKIWEEIDLIHYWFEHFAVSIEQAKAFHTIQELQELIHSKNLKLCQNKRDIILLSIELHFKHQWKKLKNINSTTIHVRNIYPTKIKYSQQVKFVNVETS